MNDLVDFVHISENVFEWGGKRPENALNQAGTSWEGDIKEWSPEENYLGKDYTQLW